MSKDAAKGFVHRLLDDGDFLAKFASIEGGEKRKQAAAKEGFDFTTDELQEAKAEYLAEAGDTKRKVKPGNGVAFPLYGVVDTWES